MRQAIVDIDRRLANIVRFGNISAINLAGPVPVVQVQIGDFTSEWLPWVALRAGRTRRWSPPDMGEQCIILSPSGDLAQGIVLPAAYQTAFPSNGTIQDLDRTDYPDGSSVEYNSDTHTLTVSVGTGNVVVNCASVTVNASTATTINSPATKITGTLEVDGAVVMKNTLEVDQSVTMKTTALVSGVASVGGLTSATPGAALVATGGMTMTGGNITADGIGLKTHTHSDPQGGTVGPATG